MHSRPEGWDGMTSLGVNKPSAGSSVDILGTVKESKYSDKSYIAWSAVVIVVHQLGGYVSMLHGGPVKLHC